MGQHIGIAMAVSVFGVRQIGVVPSAGPEKQYAGANILRHHRAGQALTAPVVDTDYVTILDAACRRILRVDQDRLTALDFAASAEDSAVVLAVQSRFRLPRD